MMRKGAMIRGNYRYQLWRIWDDSKPLVLWIMLNPSTADDWDEDNTIRRVIGFSELYGYGGFYVGNLLPYIKSDSDKVMQWYNYISNKVRIVENDEQLKEMGKMCKDVIFAWGAKGKDLNVRVNKIKQMFPKAHCLKLISGNQPAHPLYLSYQLPLLKYKPS